MSWWWIPLGLFVLWALAQVSRAYLLSHGRELRDLWERRR